MTVLEVEAWISDNYKELVSMAASKAYGKPVSLDALHSAIEGVLCHEDIESATKPVSDGTVPMRQWMASRIRGYVANENRKARHRHDANQRFGEEFSALGSDVYQDTSDAKERAHQRAAYLRRKSRGGKSTSLEQVGLAIDWDGPMPGTMRWRFQTLRDNKLFDIRAVASLRDSIRKAAARYRHHGEHGYSFTEFGQEVAR